MKKIVLAIAAIITMSTSATAQEPQNQQNGRPDRAEMIKQRTEETVTKFGLNEQQAQQLLELNTLYADSMRPQMGPRRDGRQDGMRPQRDGQRPQRDGQAREGRGQRGDRGQFGQVMERYNAQLKAIMTEEQWKAYEADREQMRQRFGQRGPRRNN